jgi:AcrR family transcriptional regulator
MSTIKPLKIAPSRRMRRARLRRQPAVRTRVRGAIRAKILQSAIEIFARNGFGGARIQKISKAARTTDRMIYYYFKSKDELFLAALETVYKELGDAESALDLVHMAPPQALRAIISFTWNHYRTHLDMLSLINNENLQLGRHVVRSQRRRELTFPLLSTLTGVLERGVEQNLFRVDIDAYDLYIGMCALAYFYLSNRFTLSAMLERELMEPRALAKWESVIQDVIGRFVGVDFGPKRS